MKILMICNTDGALYVFRKPLISRLLEARHTVGSITSESKYIEKLSRMGVKTSVVNFEGSSASIGVIVRLFLQLHQLLSSEKPDVVHSFTHKPAIYGTLAARLCGVRRIFVTITGLGILFAHDDIKTRIMRSLLLLQYKIALRFVTKIFFQNPDDRNFFLEKRLVAPHKVVLTNGSGIDVTDFRTPTTEDKAACLQMLGNELGLALAGKTIVIFSARALREKGFYEFYDAARAVNALSDNYLFIHLGLVDDDAKNGITSQRISEYSKACGVFYLGFKDNIRDYFVASDVVVLPSYREGVPRSLIEALALDKYIITTDVPGCRETVIDGWNGALCQPRDAGDLAAKIMNFDRVLLLESKGRSRALCEERFDVEQLIDTTFNCYFGFQAANG